MKLDSFCMVILFVSQCTVQSEQTDDPSTLPEPHPEENNQIPDKLNHKPARHHSPHAPVSAKGAGRSVDVPNPNSIFNQEEAEEVVHLALKDPITLQKIQHKSGQISHDVASDSTGGCLNSGSRYPTVNLQADHETHDENTDASKAKDLKVNRFYGVMRDRFFAQNVAGSMMSIQFRAGEATSAATVRGLDEDWNSEYVLAKADVFWSLDNNYGAQHAIGKQTYPFEVQLVHYKKSLKSLNEASSQKHGILVMSTLFEATGHSNTVLDPLAAAAVIITFPSNKLHMVHGPLDVKSLLPFDLSNLQYTGAYMGQPCAREAKWVVFRHPGHVSYKQLKKFREIRDTSGGPNVGAFVSLPDSESESKDKEVVVNNDVRLKILTTTENNQGNAIHSFCVLVLMEVLSLICMM